MGNIIPNKARNIEVENPIIKSVGKKNVSLLYSGYQESRIGRAFPNLYT